MASRTDTHPSGSVVVVGASLAGLMAGLALARAGVAVTVLDQASADPRHGAAVGVDDRRLAAITGLARRGTAAAMSSATKQVQAWADVHARLREAAETAPGVALHHDTPVVEVGQDERWAWAVTADGRTFVADVVIGADGHRSIVRRAVDPNKPDATFAGYVIWLGLAEEAAIAVQHWPREVAFLGGGEYYLLGYPLPGRDGSLTPGARQLGWAWYDATRNALLRDTGCVVGDIVRHSLIPSEIPDATFRELADEADSWSAPWREAVLDCIRRRAVLGTPIAEYVPDRLAHGRVALVGDAAHVPTPMTGSGFAASLDDAEAITEAVTTALGEVPMHEALRRYEHARLPSVRGMVQSGQQFSRSFARAA